MNQTRLFLRVGLPLLLSIIFIWSCNTEKKAPPFPEFEDEYTQPESRKFQFSQPDTLTWINRATTKTNRLPKTAFDWDKLPSKPFDLGGAYKLQKAIEPKPFSWDSLPSDTFSLDSLPKQKLKIEIAPLGEPKIVKAGSPGTLPESTRGVMTIDANFGAPGTVRSAIKGSDGMIWMITDGGVVRYDSQNLEIYGLDQGMNIGYNPGIFEDSKGRIWIGTGQKFIRVIDRKANLIYKISNTFQTARNFLMTEDNEGRIWHSLLGVGFNIIDLEKEIIHQLTPEHGLLDDGAFTPFKDKDGLIWLSTFSGANIIDLKNGKNYSLTSGHGLMDNNVNSFFEDEDGSLWISSRNGISILNSSKTSISEFGLEHGLDPGENAISEVFKDRSEIYWIATSNAMFYSYSKEKNELEAYKVKNPEWNYLFSLFEDDQGQIWFPSGHGGLYLLNKKNGRPGNFDINDGLGSSSFWTIREARDGMIWMGSRDGIDIYDPNHNIVKHLGEEQGLMTDLSTRLKEDSKGRIWVSSRRVGVDIIDPVNELVYHLTTSEGLETNSVVSVDEDQNGVIWMVGAAGEIISYDIEHSIMRKIARDTTLTQEYKNIVIHDANNRIWIGGLESGISIIDPEDNTVVNLTKADGLVSDRVYSLYMDSQNLIWAATHSGVVRIDPVNMELTTFSSHEGMGADDAYAILEVRGEIFVGTSNGLSMIKSIKGSNSNETVWQVRTLGHKQGLDLTDFGENSFTLDKNGKFWASLVNYVTVIDEIEVDSSRIATYISGINILDRKRIFKKAGFVDNQGSKKDTVEAVNNSSIDDRASIKSAYQVEKEIEWDSVMGPYDLPVGLKLPFNQNYLSFNLSSGQYSNPHKVVYRYILEGIDKNWSPVTNIAKSENYRDLPPGNYTFKVASKGFNGVWSYPTKLSFTILPPWWKTWWAYSIFVALFLGLGVAILHYRSQWLKRENRILEERVTHRTAQLKKTIDELENTQSQLIQSEKMASLGELTAGIAHEIQNPMNFINNFSEVTIELVDELVDELDNKDIDEAKDISKDIVQNLQKITHHGKRASSIVRGMLEHSRNSSGHKEFIDINVLADEYLRLAYHGLRAKDKSFNADFKSDFDETLPKVEIIPQDLGRVVLNIINNAFFAVASHADEQKDENYKPLVTVSTKNLGNQVLISIKDNGPGIPKEIKDKIFQPFFTTKPTGKGTGLGLSLAYDIVTSGHGGAIELNTEPGQGTEFVIYIPINKENGEKE